MFREEAQWIKTVLENIKPPPANNKVANTGASSAFFREKIQPHINDCVILPVIGNGWTVVHIDLKQHDGVDIVADIANDLFGRQYKDQFALTLCTNMLEHVDDISIAADNLLAATVLNGYILITVPYKYKLHYDPVDNGFRPSPEQIAELFPYKSVQVLDSAVITISEKAYYSVKKSRFPLWGYRERLQYYLGKRYKVSGTLLQVIKKETGI
ncbi:MAG TPA: hypothetical protein PLA68_12740 [Panacibacter sp.]|nr:hypothetical protein [Panacibacter sp.]